MRQENPDGNPYNNGFEYGVRHLLSPRSGLVSDVLLSNPEESLNGERLSVERFWELLQLGSIYVDGKRLSEDTPVLENTYIRLHTKPRRFPADLGKWRDHIIFENEDFLIVNKPSGLPVHASVDNRLENLQAYLSSYLGRELYVTHRLDVPTRGLLLFAKTKTFLSEFNKLLSERAVQKLYRARCEGQLLVPNLYQHFMEPSPRAPKKVSVAPHPLWQECLLRILTVKNLDITDMTNTVMPGQELTIELLTGRTHQIRAQLSAMKAPVIGDTLYGAKKQYAGEEIDLTAESLRFLNFDFHLPP